MKHKILLILLFLPIYLFSQTKTTSADALFKEKKFKKAIIEYSDILKSEPDLLQALEKRADCYYELKDFKNSIKDYSQALDVDSMNKSILSKRAGTYFMTKEYEKAINDYSSLINLNPKNLADLYFLRGLCKSLTLNENVEEACLDFRKAKSLGYSTSGLAGMNKYCNTTDLE